MIIYNVTTMIEEGIKQDYLDYMEQTFMPEVMSTGKFKDCKLYRLTEPVNEGITYCAQYFTENMEDLNAYRNTFMEKITHDFNQQFGNKSVSFASILAPANTK